VFPNSSRGFGVDANMDVSVRSRDVCADGDETDETTGRTRLTVFFAVVGERAGSRRPSSESSSRITRETPKSLRGQVSRLSRSLLDAMLKGTVAGEGR